MPKPVLYIFAISHYCEKACWALDYLNIDYNITHVAPGIHQRITKQLGAPRSSLPILVANGQTVQGSAQIIDWADAAASTDSKQLTPNNARGECLEIEKRLDETAGVHIRRYYYSEALVDHPETVRPIFTKDLPRMQKILVGATWSVVRKRMIVFMDLGPEQGQDSKRIVDDELSWLDGMLSDGRQVLAGDQFSRADITAASLLAPLALPKQHPTYADIRLPPNFATDLENWKNRPSLNWVREMYAKYR
jgi:glutathione S-transferase